MTNQVFDGPPVGYAEPQQNQMSIDGAPHCAVNALEACTTLITAKLCMIKIYFDNCESITANADLCDMEDEGQKCTKKMISGEVKEFQGF